MLHAFASRRAPWRRLIGVRPPRRRDVGAVIGLMAKNGILILEFANQLRDEGKSVREAVVEASVLRFRPIVMNIISTILGAVRLVIARGAGAESRVGSGCRWCSRCS